MKNNTLILFVVYGLFGLTMVFNQKIYASEELYISKSLPPEPVLLSAAQRDVTDYNYEGVYGVLNNDTILNKASCYKVFFTLRDTKDHTRLHDRDFCKLDNNQWVYNHIGGFGGVTWYQLLVTTPGD